MSLRLLGLTLVIVFPTTLPSLAITAVEWALSSILAAICWRRPNGSPSARTDTGTTASRPAAPAQRRRTRSAMSGNSFDGRPVTTITPASAPPSAASFSTRANDESGPPSRLSSGVRATRTHRSPFFGPRPTVFASDSEKS